MSHLQKHDNIFVSIINNWLWYRLKFINCELTTYLFKSPRIFGCRFYDA